MISLEKIQELDKKIQEAVTLIQNLRQDKADLQEQLRQCSQRLEEMEQSLSTAQVDQSQIEQGILGALSKFDDIREDTDASQIVEATEPEIEENDVSTADEPQEREESVIDEEENMVMETEAQEPQDSDSQEFSFNREPMEIPESDEQVNHSEPPQDRFEDEEVTILSNQPSENSVEETKKEDTGSEQDLDIF